MAAPGWNIYTAPIDSIDADMLRAFITDQREQHLLAESLTLELKQSTRDDSLVRAVAGFANNVGGIVLLGVDENTPHFDDSPGVDQEAGLRVVEACRSRLEPTVIPEIATIRIPGQETAVIVIRVEAERSRWPVTKNGMVWMRAPGQTIGATRDQILKLSTPASATWPAAPVFTLANLFRPETVEPATASETCDFVVRIAGALWLRPTAEHQLIFGTGEREALCDAFDRTAFAIIAADADGRSRSTQSRPRHEVTDRTSRLLKAAILYGPAGGDQHRMSMWLQKDGPRVAYAVTWEGRLTPYKQHGDAHGVSTPDPGPGPPEGKLYRTELAAGLLTGIEAIAIDLPNVIADLTKGAPARQDPVHAWVLGRERALSDVLDFGHVLGPADGHVVAWEFDADPAPTDLDGASALTRSELTLLYLDLGLDYEDSLAAEDVRRALSQRDIAVQWHRDRDQRRT